MFNLSRVPKLSSKIIMHEYLDTRQTYLTSRNEATNTNDYDAKSRKYLTFD